MRNACHLVCYYRYVRFLPDGRLLYRTSPEVVSQVARRLVDAPTQQGRRKDDAVQEGRYRCQVSPGHVQGLCCALPQGFAGDLVLETRGLLGHLERVSVFPLLQSPNGYGTL